MYPVPLVRQDNFSYLWITNPNDPRGPEVM